jgi:hypothetical protein|tara:strand:- start:1467 stop:1787 length:321 start_codon:yes stop_codon:yes gene_type:complete
MNAMSLMKAKMRNKLTTAFPDAQISTLGDNITISETIEKTEYNTESVSEWVDPYMKLNSKTNRYRQVKGYYRQVEKPSSLVGGTRNVPLSRSSNKEIVDKALFGES